MPDRDAAEHEANGPRQQHPDERLFRAAPVHEPAPDEAHRDRDEGEHEQDQVRVRLAQAHRLHDDHAHHDDDRVDRIGIEEPAEQEAPQAGDLAGVLDRAPELAHGARDVTPRERPSSGRWASRTNQKIGMANTRNRTAVSRNRSATGMSSKKINSPTKTVPK